MPRPISILVACLSLSACGASDSTTPASPGEGSSAGGSAGVPAEETPGPPTPPAEPRLDRYWVASSSELPFRVMRVFPHNAATGEVSWCADLDAQALGSWPIAVDHDSGTMTLWLRPGGPAGSPPTPAPGAPCPAVFPSTGPSDAMLPTSAPAVLRCVLVEGGLRCSGDWGGHVEFTQVSDRLSLPTLQDAPRSPHAEITGMMSCGSCAAGWDERLTLMGPAISLDGESLYLVRGQVSAVLGVLADNADARFSIEVDDCGPSGEECLD